MANAPDNVVDGDKGGLVKSPLDFGGGLFLLALGVVGYLGAFSLPFGNVHAMGSGLLPKSVSLLVAAFGAGIALQGLLFKGDRLEAWGIRGPVFVLGAVIVFAATIRPFGLAIAGPLCIIVAGMADRDSRPVELIVFSLVMSALCVGLFKFILKLSIPVFPAGYGPF